MKIPRNRIVWNKSSWTNHLSHFHFLWDKDGKETICGKRINSNYTKDFSTYHIKTFPICFHCTRIFYNHEKFDRKLLRAMSKHGVQ